MAAKQKRRADKLYERKVWIPLPEGTVVEDQTNTNIRYNEIKNVYEKRRSFYDPDKRLLDIRVNEIENQINKGIYVLDNDSTFEQNIRKWFKVHAPTIGETTQESYKIYMNHAIRLAGSKKIQSIKPMDIQEMYNKFLAETFQIKEDDKNYEKYKHKIGQKLHNKNSLKHLHVVVNSSFEFAVNNSILHKNPCDKINKKEFKPDAFESYTYTEDEFKELMNCVMGSGDDEIIVLLAGGAGLRAGEICALKWIGLDINKNQITINKSRFRTTGKVGEKETKTNKIRTFDVDSYIIENIMKYKNNSDYVLCRSTGKPYRNDELYHKFMDVLTKYNLTKTRLHDLRHYNATMMALYGVDIKTAAKRLGDNPETVLKIYQHVQEKMDRGAAEKLGKMFKDNKNSSTNNTLELYKHLNDMQPDELEKLISKAKESLNNSSVVTSVVNDENEKSFATTEIVGNP